MSVPQFSTLNLNLLVSLDALLDTCSVRRAAERTGVTQSAMSQSLRQLRDAFGDPLLVRAGNGMLATPRGNQIAGPLRQALQTLRQVVEHQDLFDPGTSTRTFVVATFDSLAVFPALLKRLRATAPGVQLVLVPFDPQALETRLASGAVDLAVGRPLPRPTLKSAVLFENDHVVLARAEHPGIGQELDLETFCRLPHVVVGTGPSTGVVDEALAKLGRSRHVVVRLPYFLVVPALVAESDLLHTLPRVVGEHLAAHYRLSVHSLPLDLPRVRISMTWHERCDADPGLAWLRGCLVEATSSLRPPVLRSRSQPAKPPRRR